MTLRVRLQSLTDRVVGASLVGLLLGTTVAFGGRVWWAPLAAGALCLVLVAGCLFRTLLDGRVRMLKSPLTLIGLMTVGVALLQLTPLPAAISEKLSPASRAAYGTGMLPQRVQAIDPDAVLPEGPTNRAPVSLDRPATLRWLAGAAACLAVFWAVAQYADRLGHLYIVWGSIVAGFFLNTAIAAVQLASGNGGLFGYMEPGRGPSWGPNPNDLLASPNTTVLRGFGEAAAGKTAWALAVADRPFQVGTQLGGSGAYLALGSIGLPVALALALQLLAPRGSRESLGDRLGQSGQASLVVLVYGLLLASSLLVGLLAGPLFCIPFGFAMAVVGLLSAWPSGLRWTAVSLTSFAVLALAGGAALGQLWAASIAAPPPAPPLDLRASERVWTDALSIARDFPILGTGLGTFATVYPYYKTQDGSPTTAMSSLLQWWIESGFVGLGLLGLAALWCLWRTPGALRRVGTADRALACGLIGAAAGFTLFSAVHWTVELASVALSASAVGGACNRWLAGGTDLFVERG